MDLKQKPTIIEYTNGTKEWFLNDKLHREDGPACEYANGDKFWYRNGQLHRIDGPAAEYANGDAAEYVNEEKYWYIHGKRLTLMQFINHDLVSEETVQEVLTKWI